jgi:beta-galactosidase/beta-glucuronidase
MKFICRLVSDSYAKKMTYKRALALSVLIILGYVCFPIIVSAQDDWKMQDIAIATRWSKDVNPANVLSEYPRPQMVRGNWENLNGLWQYAITSNQVKKASTFEGTILVPYPVESALSGVMKSLLPDQILWYKRTIKKPATKPTERILLHFGGVDWQSTIYVNGKEVGKHTGGYQNFSFDITGALQADTNELVVKVYDPSNKGINPHGKQFLYPSFTSYTPSSGIWQTVWMETVPAQYISSIVITPDVDQSVVLITVNSKAYDIVQLEAD